MAKPKILLPGSPEFQAIIKASEKTAAELKGMDFSGSTTAAEVSLREERLGRFTLKHALIKQTDEISKLVFYFCELSPKLMADLAQFMYAELVGKMKPTSAIKAGVSPVFRGQWDLILFHVPNFEAKMTYDAILSLIRKYGSA